MKVKLGKKYGDGSQDLIIDNMTHAMKENLIRLGLIKAVEDSVSKNAEWFRDPEPDPYDKLVCEGCSPDTCVGCGEGEKDENEQT